MFKKLSAILISLFLLVNIYGCFALFAGGVVAGAGTAVWLSGKLIQQVDYPIDKTARTVREALSSSGFPLTYKEDLSKGFVQIRSYDKTKEKIWIDIFRTSGLSSQVQVRVGTFVSNKESAEKILRLILKDL